MENARGKRLTTDSKQRNAGLSDYLFAGNLTITASDSNRFPATLRSDDH
jgi:hypothetical protein